MNKDKKNIDQLFKEGLGKSTYEVPEAFEKDLIQKLNKNEQKKNRAFFWWLLFFLMIDFSIAVLLIFDFQKSSTYTKLDATINPVEISSTMRNSNNYDEITEKHIDKNKIKHSESASSSQSSDLNGESQFSEKSKDYSLETKSKSSVFKEEKNLSSLDKDIKSERTKKSNENKFEELNSDREDLKSGSAILLKDKKEDKHKMEERKQRNLTEAEQLEADLIKENDNHQEASTTNNSEENKNSPSLLTKEEIDKNNHTASPQNETGMTDSNEVKKDLEPILLTSEDSIKNLSDSIDEVGNNKQDSTDSERLLSNDENEELDNSNENKTTKQGKRTGSNWNADIQVYSGFSSSIINDRATNESYLNAINKDRKPLNSIVFGVNGNLSYKNTTFGLGLTYMNTGETYSFDKNKINFSDFTYYEYDSLVENISYYKPNGDPIGDTVQLTVDTLVQTETVSDTTFTRKEIKNSYSWISVPIHFGYRFDFGKYQLTPRVGVQLNVGITQNAGQYPTTNFEEIKVYNATKFNASYLINVELKRNFNQWNVFARPYFKSMFDPAVNENLIKRKYSPWGVELGVGFDL